MGGLPETAMKKFEDARQLLTTNTKSAELAQRSDCSLRAGQSAGAGMRPRIHLFVKPQFSPQRWLVFV
jgi:hypothetical protein